MKDFLQRVLVHAPNIDVDFDEIVLKEKFSEYVEYYLIISNEIAKKNILEKLGFYLVFCESLRDSIWTRNYLSKLGSNSNEEIRILKLISSNLESITKILKIINIDEKDNTNEIGFTILDIIYDNIGVIYSDEDEFDFFL